MSKPRKKAKDLSLVERLQAPTPKFFRIIRNIGGAIAAVGSVAAVVGKILVVTGVAAPAGAILIAAGTAAAAALPAGTASLVVDEEALNKDAEPAGEQPLNTPGGF